MSAKLYPSLSDIRLGFDLLIDADSNLIEDVEFRALLSLVRACAANLVWTYTEPGDGSLPDDDIALAKLTRLSPRAWSKVRSEIEPFFIVSKGRWHLAREWVTISSQGRMNIPAAIYAEVMARQGKSCTYCGDTSGPFHLDHIFPVSKGGTNAPSNLTLACQRCNLSKGDKTLREWMEEQRGAVQ